jgi:hypothetical protein
MDISLKYFLLFITGVLLVSYAIYLYKVKKLNRTSHVFYYHKKSTPIPDIETIGKITPAGKGGTLFRPDTGAVRLYELGKLFKYRESKHTYWVTFTLENNAHEDTSMVLTETRVNIAGRDIECNLVLSMGNSHGNKGLNKNRYFNTRTHNHFMLGKSSEKYLNFQARFLYEDIPAFKTTDFLEIHFDLMSFNNGSKQYELEKQDYLRVGFHDMKYKQIDMVNEELEYHS